MADSSYDQPLHLRMRDRLTIVVPPTLSSITTYVLLEQEQWFESELNFLREFLKPGMTAIDIGANLGVYCLPMARLVGSGGRVFAYEPGGDTRALLEQSRDINELSNLTVGPVALSDNEREAILGTAASSELRALTTSGAGERVHVTSLDREDSVRGWGNPDFVKIDAEGEEENILAGGADFFAKYSPLIMFEIKAGDKVNERLRSIFPAMGYRLFRQLGTSPILIPDHPQQALDNYVLNLFAAKPDRVKSLAQCGLLVETIPDWTPNETDRKVAIEDWKNQPFTSRIGIGGAHFTDSDYRDSFAAYGTWRSSQMAATRCAALAFAFQRMRALCLRAPTIERLSTFARIAFAWGERGAGVGALQQLLTRMKSGPIRIVEPFWPACVRFDTLHPGERPLDWIAASAAEQFERSASFSSAFTGRTTLVDWLCHLPFASAEMERRRVLTAARSGQQVLVPAKLCTQADDHLNSEVWKSGQVPGTIVTK